MESMVIIVLLMYLIIGAKKAYGLYYAPLNAASIRVSPKVSDGQRFLLFFLVTVIWPLTGW